MEPHTSTLPKYNGKEIPDLREYRSLEKLAGKADLITGRDPGIGKDVAILFARQGGEAAINYLPEKLSNAEEVKKAMEKERRKRILIPQNIRE